MIHPTIHAGIHPFGEVWTFRYNYYTQVVGITLTTQIIKTEMEVLDHAGIYSSS